MAGRFEDAVKERLGPREERPEYTSERTHGIVAAKTINQAGGSIEIVFNGELMRSETQTAEGMLRRLAAHEAYHAVINQRGEDVIDIRDRHRLPAYSERGIFGELAAHACDE